MQMIAKDKLGQEIKVGEYVVYRLSGRSGDIEYGKVTNIKFALDVTGQLKLDRNGEPIPTIYVRHVRDYNSRHFTPEVAERDSRLPKTESIVIYPIMPQWVRDLFAQAGL